METLAMLFSQPNQVLVYLAEVVGNILLAVAFSVRIFYAFIPGAGIVIMARRLLRLRCDPDDLFHPFRRSPLVLWLIPLLNFFFLVFSFAEPHFLDFMAGDQRSAAAAVCLMPLLTKLLFFFNSLFLDDVKRQ